MTIYRCRDVDRKGEWFSVGAFDDYWACMEAAKRLSAKYPGSPHFRIEVEGHGIFILERRAEFRVTGMEGAV